MTFQLQDNNIEEILDLRRVMHQVLNTEPGLHPELPETIHKLLKALITSLLQTATSCEELRHELAQHKMDQGVSEAALLGLFMDLGLFNPETYQQAVAHATEKLGGINVGQA